jgi:hypothetical protein
LESLKQFFFYLVHVYKEDDEQTLEDDQLSKEFSLEVNN